MSAQQAVRSDAARSRLERVLALAGAMLAKKARPPAEPDADLRAAGLSSLDAVNLMLAVEGEFDLFFPPGEMTPENFRSARTIAALLDRLL